VCREEDSEVDREQDKEEEGNRGLLDRGRDSLSFFPFSFFLPSLCLCVALAAVILVAS
jgi:hypothetical protein